MKRRVPGVAALVLMACSSAVSDNAGSTVPIATETTAPTSATTIVVTTKVPPSTKIERVPASELSSSGEITIGSRQFAFAFECYAAGAGDVLALGVGDDPETGESTQAVVQAFLGQPYVAVLFGEGTIFELAIDRHVELFQQESAILGSALRFVDATNGAGESVEIGLGTVAVTCDGFAPGLPDGYLTSSPSTS